MVNLKKLIKKIRLAMPSKKHDVIHEYQDDYVCLVNKQIKRALENRPLKKTPI